MSSADHVAIVGASLAGQRTIRGLRRRGFDGRITLIGAESHLPYDRPPLSKDVLTSAAEPDRLALVPDDFYDDVDVLLGVPAASLDLAGRAVVLEDDRRVVADHVVVATGAAPRRLPGTDGIEGVLTLRTIDDALALRRAFGEGARVAVIGAGFIGCEVAASARVRGLDVTVVDVLDTPVVRGVGPVVGRAVADLHRQHGVQLRLGVGVEGIEDDGGAVTGLRLADGQLVEADVVVVGIGAVPVTGWLEGSGLTLDNGVVCDDHCRVVGGGGHVWAAGDVARWPSALAGGLVRMEHWTNAADQAMAVATNLVGHDRAGPYDPVPYVWSDQYAAKLQVMGHVHGDDEVTVVAGSLDDLDTGRFLASYVRDGALVGVAGANWPKAVMGAKRLIAEGAPLGELASLVADTS